MTMVYLFDYGGTLDTGGVHWGKLMWHAYHHQGVPVSEQQFREAYVYAERWLGHHKLIAQHYTFRDTLAKKLLLQLHYLSDGHSSLLNYFPVLLEELYQEACQHTASSRRVLTELKRRGHRLCIVSNFYGNLPTVLREFGLLDLFDAVVESARVGVRKPDPRIFRLGAEAMGVSPADCMVVGDSIQKDMLPALEAGCKAIWLEGEPWEKQEADPSHFEKVISQLEQLL